jgi:alpha-L-arabinofuranosidase
VCVTTYLHAHRFNTSGPSWYAGAPRAMFPFWYGSVAEAIYLLSAERNSDNILGAGYAPGFMNLNRWEWIPDMIAYDANPANLVLSTSYYVVQLLASVHITETLPTSGGYDPAYWVAGKGESDDSRIVKAVVYNSTGSVPFSVDFAGISDGQIGKLTYLTAPMNASNYVGENYVETHKETIKAKGTTFSWEMPEYSVGILEVGECGGKPWDWHGWNWGGWGWNRGHGGHGGHRGHGWKA